MTTPSKSNDTPSKQHHTPDKQTPDSTQRTHAEHPDPLTTLQQDEAAASSAPSSVLQIPFRSGMAFSSLTFTTSSAQSNMGGSGSTPMSTPFRARSDLNSARKLRLINEQENLKGDIDVNTVDNQVVIWGTDVHVNECKCRFISFLKKFHPNVEEANPEGADPPKPFYMQKLDEIHLLKRPFLNVDSTHIKQIDKTMHNQLVSYPQEVIFIFDKAVNELFFTIYKDDILPHQIQVRPYNVDMFKNMRCLDPKDINKLVTLTGIVIGSSLKMLEMSSANFSCNTSTFDVQVEIDHGQIAKPTLCTSCNTAHSFELIHNRSLFADKQFIKLLIQETSEEMPARQTSVSVTIVAHNDLVNAVQLGDRIQVTGIFCAVPARIRPKKRNVRSVCRTFIDVIHFRPQKIFTTEGGIEDQATNDDEESSSSKFSKERLAQFQNLSERPDIYELLSNAIAPSIFGHKDIKKGILLQLFGGTKKNFTDAGRNTFRSQVNILLCGDQGTAKSQLQQYIFQLVPRAQYTNGKGTSAVGLTAYVGKNPKTGRLVLETGALVLADNSICCIDEFDKMNESARSILHEVMKRQILSIAKDGITYTLNARTSILAAANPIESQWNKSKTIIENTQLPPTLLSYFDLIFLLLDSQNEAYDRRLAQHLALWYQYGKEGESAHEAMDADLLRDYISYARTFVSPQLTEAAEKLLVSSYNEMRKVGSGQEQISAYPRQLESLIRLAEAHAKVRLSAKVEKVDVEEATRLYRKALKQAVVDSETGRGDVAILTTDSSASERYRRADLVQTLENHLEQHKSTQSTRPINRDILFNEIREQIDESITRNIFDDAIRVLEEKQILVVTNDTIRFVLSKNIHTSEESEEFILDLLKTIAQVQTDAHINDYGYPIPQDPAGKTREATEQNIAKSTTILTTTSNNNVQVLHEHLIKLLTCRDKSIERIDAKGCKNVDEKLPLMDYNEELYFMDYDDGLDEEEITQQQQQTASTSPIDTGSSPNLIYSMMQYYMSQYFLVQNFLLLGSVFNGLYVQLLMDSLAGDPNISRHMVADNPMFADNPNLRAQLVYTLSALMEKMKNPEVQALMQDQKVLTAITQVQDGLRQLHAAALNLFQVDGLLSNLRFGSTVLSSLANNEPFSLLTTQSTPFHSIVTRNTSSLNDSNNYAGVFAQMFNMTSNQNINAPLQQVYAAQLQQLAAMGFTNREANIGALTATMGDANAAAS